MLKKQPLTISDRARWQEALSCENSRNASLSFAGNFLWHRHCTLQLVEAEGRLSIEYPCQQWGHFCLFPVGRGELRSSLAALMADGGDGFTLRFLDAEQAALLETLFPGHFTIEEDRNNADYLYSVQSFATLSGKKLHGKRNFCNRFEAAHRWEALPLQKAQFPVCLALFERWAENREGTEDERTALSLAFAHWDTLQLEGTVLYCENEPIAFSIGDRLNEDTFDICFEKAAADIPGAYPMIARESAKQLLSAHPELTTLNREEDMGIPGLRKAKQEWFPRELMMKYVAKIVRS